MISLSHFGNGNRIALNVDLIEKVEETPDTIITLTNGARYLVEESIEEIMDKSAQARAHVMFLAQTMMETPSGRRLRLVRGESGDSADGSDEAPR